MRLRFFLIIFVMLSAVALSTSVLYNFFLQQERIRLIDQQVRNTAETLLGSELAELNKFNMNRAEKIISEELGKNRIGKFFILHGENEQILFQSGSAHLLKIKAIPETPQWITIRDNNQYIRVLNLSLPRIEGRTLQVGLVIDESILSPPLFSKNTITYFATTLFTGLLISFFLTSILLKPIRRIADFIFEISDSKQSYVLPKPPTHLTNMSRYTKNDEYLKLINGFNNLIEKVNRGYNMSRMWSYQMAHELKTPLAIMETEIEIAIRENKVDPEVRAHLQKEISNLSDTVSAFLSWAEIENNNKTLDLHSIRASSVLKDIVARLTRKYDDRFLIEVKNDFYIEANPYHLEILLQNILLNALNYSEPHKVEIVIDQDRISVKDHGQGIPKLVLERMGEPFNVSHTNANTKSNGLGLAFIHSVSKTYNWDLNIATSAEGTLIQVNFLRSASLNT